MRIIIPMAGSGNRFTEKGYQDPKPFIQVNGKCMIRRVIDSLQMPNEKFVLLCRKEHLNNYNLNEILHDIDFEIVEIDQLTEGAAITVSMAKAAVNLDEDILIVNSDQLLHFDPATVTEVRLGDANGCIWCFIGSGNNWSYARLDQDGYVTEVAEKKQISTLATSGMYYWRTLRNFLESLDKMVEANDRTNNEFYVAPVYNYIEEKKVIVKMVDSVEQLGTPEELLLYLEKVGHKGI